MHANTHTYTVALENLNRPMCVLTRISLFLKHHFHCSFARDFLIFFPHCSYPTKLSLFFCEISLNTVKKKKKMMIKCCPKPLFDYICFFESSNPGYATLTWQPGLCCKAKHTDTHADCLNTLNWSRLERVCAYF